VLDVDEEGAEESAVLLDVISGVGGVSVGVLAVAEAKILLKNFQ
jgi:hypothetical protein